MECAVLSAFSGDPAGVAAVICLLIFFSTMGAMLVLIVSVQAAS